MNIRRIGFGMVLMIVGVGTAQAQPSNDNCGSATIIPGNTVNFNPVLLTIVTTATTELCEAQEDCEVGNVGTSNSVWYSYTPDQDGSIIVDTFGSSYDTVLSVFDRCGTIGFPFCNSPIQLACNDNQPFGLLQSEVFLDVTAGVTYLIKVARVSSSPVGLGQLDFNFRFLPPNDRCMNATPIVGVGFDPPLLSTHNATTGLCEALESCEANNVGVSNAVWYSFLAPCDGLVSADTNGSNYDTVLSIFDGCGEFVGVDFPCDMPNEIACDDDGGTGLQSQLTNVPVVGGVEYIIKVADFNTTQGGGFLDFNFQFQGASPPVAEITSPTAFACVCNSVNIEGSANASGDPFADWTLEFQLVGGSSWTLIASDTSPVTNGLLGNWNASALSQGHYVLRLTVENACGETNTAVQVVFVDKVFDNLELREPKEFDVFAANVCVDGTAWDQCFDQYTVDFRPVGGASFNPVDPANPVFNVTVINDPLASWDTIGGGIADGDYQVRLQGTDQCGHVVRVIHTITVDNTVPTAIISMPLNCTFVDGLVQVFGTADDTNLASWVLQYTGGNENGWVNITSDSVPVINNLLGTWDTTALPACPHTIRLVVTDKARINCLLPHRTEFTVTVDLGLCCDLNGDGSGDGLDVAPFVQCLLFGAGCP